MVPDVHEDRVGELAPLRLRVPGSLLSHGVRDVCERVRVEARRPRCELAFAPIARALVARLVTAPLVGGAGAACGSAGPVD